ncbi:MAG: maleylpyruvate isomerase family mycothiol-dependent enzyme [Acidimicrobiia bacterium]
MENLLADLGAQHAELWGLIEHAGAGQWAAPSPCEGWDVADVVLHLHQTDELALATLRGDLAASIEGFMRSGDDAVDAAAAASVAGARGADGPAVAQWWAQSAAALRAELAAAEPGTRVQWVVGRLSVRTLAATRLAECWIHTTDVAAGLGTEVAPTARLRPIARLAWRTVPYAFERAGAPPPGPVGFALVGPDGESWEFGLDEDPPTVVRGPALDLCLVAGRRRTPEATALTATGPDADRILTLVRTYA